MSLKISMFFLLGIWATGAYAQSYPNCTSPDSDHDGDGYGWEEEATCIMPANSCEDRGGYPWGWNPTSLTSCRLDVQGSESTSSLLDKVVVGSWICKDMVLSSGYYDPGVSRSGPQANTTVAWQMSGISSSNAGYFPDESQPEECHYFSGAQYPQISMLEFSASGEVKVEQNLGLLSTSEGCSPSSRTEFYRSEIGEWSFDGYLPTVAGESFKSIAFQSVQFEGSTYELMHLNRTDYSRLSCRNGADLTGLFGMPDWSY